MEPKNPLLYNVNYPGVEINLTPPNHRTPVWLAWLKVLLYPLQWLHNNFFQDYANGSSYAFYDATKTYNVGDRVIDIDNAVYECEYNNTVNYTPHLNTGVLNYTFTSHGGTDELHGGTGINFSNFSGSYPVTYTITIVTGTTFNWADSTGNSFTNITTGNSVLLSFGVTINIGGTIATNDTYTFTLSNTVVWWLVNPDYRGVRPRSIFNGQKMVLEGILNQYFRTTFRNPPYMKITAVELLNPGSGYVKPIVTITGANGTGIDAVVDAKANTSSPYEITKLTLANPGFNYLNVANAPTGGISTATLTIADTNGPGANATGKLYISGNKYPDIFINNNIFPNSVFIVGFIEAESSAAVYRNGEAVNFVELEGSDYNFNATDFTIFVPKAFFESLAGSSVGSIDIVNPGSGYGPFSILSVTITGGGGVGATASASIFTIFETPHTWSYIINVKVDNPGYGYTSPPMVTINTVGGGGGGSGATATANLEYLVSEKIIRNIADKYVIAGMTYGVETY